jgi:hypothetical protein
MDHNCELRQWVVAMVFEFNQSCKNGRRWAEMSLKIRDSNTFKLDLNWGYTKINLILFEDFLNLELLEINLNNSNLNRYIKRMTFK